MKLKGFVELSVTFLLNVNCGHFMLQGSPRLQSVATLLAAWLIVAVCLVRGIKSSGKVVYFTSLFPYALLIVLAGRAFSLPGAVNGVITYLTPHWDRLLDIGAYLALHTTNENISHSIL